jgi:hypothetical protein
MRCLWRLWPWAKRQKPHDEEDSSLLCGRTTIIQSWELALKNDLPGNVPESNLRERYVRFGIGGAGNLRKF